MSKLEISKNIKKLLAIKFLIFEATKTTKNTNVSGTQLAFAVLNAHDALDWTVQLISEESNIKITKKQMYLVDYADEVEKLFPKSVNISNVKKLNDIRKLFKHQFILPDKKDSKEIVEWTEKQIDILLINFFQTPLNNIDLINAITDEKVKRMIISADENNKSGKIIDGYGQLSIAYEILKHNSQIRLESDTGKKVFFNSDFSFSSSFFLHIEDMLDKNKSYNGASQFAKAWDSLIQSVEYLVDISFVNILGIDLKQYFEFLSVTPRPQLMMNGNYIYDMSQELEKRMKSADYKTQREFVIESVLMAQGKY